MKKFIILGIILSSIFLFTACSEKGEKTFVNQHTEVKNDKSTYKEEIPIKQLDVKQKPSTIKPDDKKDVQNTSPLSVATASTIPADKKIGWGLKRNSDHKTPEVYQSTKDLFKKYNTLFVGDEKSKVIYLTFDEGYENGFTPKILDTLKANDVKAAFFVTGPYIKDHTDLVQRMIDEGHIIGNHTINHPSLPELTSDKVEAEILGLDKMFYDHWGKNMKFMRPPKGEYSENVLGQLDKLGYRTVFWSFAYDDYDVKHQKGTDYAYKLIMGNLHNGAIYLLHAVSKDNTEVLDRVIKDIKAQGYTFKGLDSIQ